MNDDIRGKMKAARVMQYEVCAELEISESTFIRWLRLPLTDERRQKIIDAIERAKKRGV